MEVVTGEQMRRIDRRAIEEHKIPSLELMEHAGRGVAAALIEDYPDVAGLGVLVVCGKGNNGGDGLVAARYLAQHGAAPHVVLLARGDTLGADAAQNLLRARQAGIDVREAADVTSWNRERVSLEHRGIVLDALLGTGIKGGAEGPMARAIEDVNRAGRHVISIDLPSGLDADRGAIPGAAIVAERTYTLCRPKVSLVLEPAAGHCGPWRVISIGIPDEAVQAEHPALSWIDAAAVAEFVRPRPMESHKGTYGHLLAIAGSAGKSGAATLLARGALRCGVGLITAATPASVRDRVALQQAEVMTEALAETPRGGLATAAVRTCLDLAEQCTAVAIGPGLGLESETRDTILRVIERCLSPLVIDADALNALAARRLPVARLATPHPNRAVLTPHPGEAARLLSCTAEQIQAARLESAQRLAQATDAVVVLKGHRTLVAAPDGKVAVNSTGNPGMATGGMGDVLTGCIGAFLARGLSPWDASRLAVYVHGDAGDRAARDVGPVGITATDLAARLPRALGALLRV
jgi:ADP-dependent NAD(P)H-hydrate dehydratase / NAD(P)H-hydrate epimerase